MDIAAANPDSSFATTRQPKLLDQLRVHLRTRNYSIRTEVAYVDRARRFILLHSKRHPHEMGAAGRGFLSPLDAL